MWVFWPKVIGYFDISQRLTAVIFSFRIFQRSILLQQNVSVLSLWISGFKPNYYRWKTKYERCERDAHGAVQNCGYKNILTSLSSCHVAVKLFFVCVSSASHLTWLNLVEFRVPDLWFLVVGWCTVASTLVCVQLRLHTGWKWSGEKCRNQSAGLEKR